MQLPPFIDRDRELQALTQWCSRQRATPLYIYGPEGCGKTRLLKEFTRRAPKLLGGDTLVVYIDALEWRDPQRAVLATPLQTSKLVAEVIADLLETGVPVGSALAQSISLVIDKIAVKLYSRRLRGKHVVVIVDDVTRAIGLDKVEWYVKYLYELMWKLHEDYEPKTINIIVTTSEGLSLKLIHRHRHALTALLWNLDKQSFKQLFQNLHPPENMEFEDIWTLLGGNPGKLLELATNYNWSINAMLEAYRDRLLDVIKRVVQEGLKEHLVKALEDPDTLLHATDPRTQKLEEILVENNLVMRLGLRLDNTRLEPNKELGIGKYYAWQIPMYRQLLTQLLKAWQ